MKDKNTNESNQLPIYNLQVVQGKYPFKNAHINKIFDVHVYQNVQVSKNMNKIIDVFNQDKGSLLININKLTKLQNQQIKINYEYVQTPLNQYIRRYINESIQIKMENLLLMLRQLVYKFTTKNVNILDGLSIHNIGVKMVDGYRQSMMLDKEVSRKQLVMPDFKIFIDLMKCSYVQKLQDVGRLVIQSDKKICSLFRQQIDQIIDHAIKQHNQQFHQMHKRDQKKILHNVSLSRLDIIHEETDLQFKNNNNIEKGLQFTQKRRKIRKNNDKINKTNKTQQEVNGTPMVISLKQNEKVEIQNYKNLRTSLGSNEMKVKDKKDENLKLKIQQLVERSRKNLKVFRDKFMET